MRLIDADALIEKLDAEPEGGYYSPHDVISLLITQPTIEPKTGQWIAKEDRPKQEVFICSECGGWAYSPWIGSRKNPKPNRCKYTFCPNCGSYNGGKNEM